MLNDLEDFYLKKEEPNRSCLLALRDIFLSMDKENISVAWRYNMPFFFYKGKRICYIRVDKKSQLPYIGIVEGYRIDHPALEKGSRSKMKTLPIDPTADLDLELIQHILKKAVDLVNI